MDLSNFYQGSVKKTALSMIITGLLVGCGGGSSDKKSDTAPQNKAPTVSAASVEVQETKAVTITANANDTDGSIASYLWKQVSGPTVELGNTSSNSLSFTAPAVTQDTELTFSVTVTDNQGASASANVKATVKANMVSVTLKGKVTDSPIANAKVKVTVGNKEFDVQADKDGNYTLALSADDSQLNDLIKVVAVGEQADSNVKLVSYLSSLDAAIKASGEDKQLTKDELFAVNVTNVSTAVSALLQQQNEDKPVTSVESLNQLATQYDPELILPLATAIKLVIDFSRDHPNLTLPEGVKDTFELVKSLDKTSDYLTEAKKNSEAQVVKAENEIVEDDELVSTNLGSQEDVLGIYYLEGEDGSSSGVRFELKQGGTGNYAHGDRSREFTWELDSEEGLVIRFDGEGFVTFEGITRHNGAWIERKEIAKEIILKQISNSNGRKQMMRRILSKTVYPNGERPNVPPRFLTPETQVYVTDKGLVNSQPLIKQNVIYSIPTVQSPAIDFALLNKDVVGNSGAMKVTFTDTNKAKIEYPHTQLTGDIQYQTIDASYQFDDQGKLTLSANDKDSNPVTWNYAFLSNSAPYNTNLHQVNSNKNLMGVTSDQWLVKEANTEWTATNAVGIYKLPWNFFDATRYFWVEINADGTSKQVSTNDYNNDGELTPNEIEVTPTRWKLNDSGTISIRRYREKVGNGVGPFCQSSSYEPSGVDNCVLWHEREWDLYAKTGNQYHMMHFHNFYHRGDGKRSGFYVDNRTWEKVAERPIKIDD
ncbi:MAG: PKD domain-containing protein [Parashewanella sp.]